MKLVMPKGAGIFGILLCVFASLRLDAPAQIKPVYDQGALGLGRLLKRLNTTASVMMIGAHPDDEDTALLAYLARGENARTAYLSLTRGDGGQNIIGPELGEALGVIRTEELLQARKLDGAEQYFTRAYDYGFSKTLEEAKQKWDEKIVLCDAVRVIRQFRPLVVVSQFSGTPADGHGQHQFSGYIAPIAVKAAADGSQCTDAGPAWQVKKFYVRHGFRATGEPRLRVNTGKFDPMLGRSYFEIAMEARSQHRSQEQGVLELRGEQFSGLNLSDSAAKEAGIFDGIDTSPADAAKTVKADESAVRDLFAAAQTALAEYDPTAPEKIVPALVKGYSIAAANETSFGSARTFFAERKQLFAEAIVFAGGIQIDALVDRETVVPGESFSVGVKVYSPLKDVIRVKEINLAIPDKPPPFVSVGPNMNGWSVTRRSAPTANSPFFVAREIGIGSEYFNVTAPGDSDLTSPYWLVEPRRGDLFTFSGPASFHGLPVQPSFPRASIMLEVAGVNLFVDRPVEYRFADDIRGEIRRNLAIVPVVNVELDLSMMVVPYSDKAESRRVAVTVTNNSTKSVAGTVSLSINADHGWKLSASSPNFDIRRSGERQTVPFDLTVPARTKAGNYLINAAAGIGENRASSTMRTISYPHIQTHRYYRPAAINVRVIDLKTASVKVGYIAGSGDRVPQAIAQMGFYVETIDERTLASGDLSQFDAIVVGIRAYQVRPDVVANNKRLLDFANAGGTLIVQYQLPAYTQQNLAPFPAQQGPRVSDELAKVTVLEPTHPILNAPNEITDADFAGWVQERNLYNFSTMDAKYVGLLESHDAGEAENKGGLVVADVGKGKYVYCSYSLFRQLPAGVPGAYRLLANMLAYSGKKRAGK